MEKKDPQNIQERTFEFGVRIVDLVNRIPRTLAGEVLARQLVRSGLSVGSNVEEADGAESINDFIHKMSIAHKEARESRHWPRVILRTIMKDDPKVQSLWKEADEIVRLLFTIIKNS